MGGAGFSTSDEDVETTPGAWGDDDYSASSDIGNYILQWLTGQSFATEGGDFDLDDSEDDSEGNEEDEGVDPSVWHQIGTGDTAANALYNEENAGTVGYFDSAGQWRTDGDANDMANAQPYEDYF